MKLLACLTLSFAMTSSAWAAKAVTVLQLQQTLSDLTRARKSDQAVADKLKDLQLTEQLTHTSLSSLLYNSPGQLTSMQLYALEAESALLAPPPAELPAQSTPDLPAQRAIMARAVDFVLKNYMQNPPMTALKTIFSYPNLVPNPQIDGASDDAFLRNSAPTHTETVTFQQEVEQDPVSRQNFLQQQYTPRPTSGPGAGPVLSVILQQAAQADTLVWQRWELLDKTRAAVFFFAVDKRRSLYRVDTCCVPDSDQATSNRLKPAERFHNRTETVADHGQFFVDPASGAVLRLNVQADLAPTDLTHREDSRVDYGPILLGGRTFFVPLRAFTIRNTVATFRDYLKLSYQSITTVNIDKYANYQLSTEPTQAHR